MNGSPDLAGHVGVLYPVHRPLRESIRYARRPGKSTREAPCPLNHYGDSGCSQPARDDLSAPQPEAAGGSSLGLSRAPGGGTGCQLASHGTEQIVASLLEVLRHDLDRTVAIPGLDAVPQPGVGLAGVMAVLD